MFKLNWQNLTLPIVEQIPDIKHQLMLNHSLILEAAPGAGKTTVVPLALLDESWLKGRKIYLLVPRRMAARAAAERMASLLGESVGQSVGYRVRQETKVSKSTLIEVLTFGVYLRILQNDPDLSKSSLIIFDEFHERSLDADLCFSLTLQARELYRDQGDPLKIMIMSATLQDLNFEKVLPDVPSVVSEGRQFPVALNYLDKLVDDRQRLTLVKQKILYALKNNQGSLLVFLPGEKEIKAIQTQLEEEISEKDIIIAPLYGALAFEKQALAISHVKNKEQRKIVLATDIAETSLTIEGINIVIDSGLKRTPKFDPNTAMTRLHTGKISVASATQRSGRAGRLSAGVCYRLWTESQHHQLARQTPAEILNADLSSVALQMIHWGVDKPEELNWFNEPPSGAFQQALDLLENLGAIKITNSNCQLSDIGNLMAKLPCHPRLAHMLVEGYMIGEEELACELASLLSERGLREGSDDISRQRILAFESGKLKSSSFRWQAILQKQKRQFIKELDLLADSKLSSNNCRRDQTIDRLSVDELLAYLLACAYPDRIAKHVNGLGYQLSNGRRARLSDESDLLESRWLLVCNLGGFQDRSVDRIYSAINFYPELFEKNLEYLVKEEDKFEWDKQKEKFIAEKRRCVGAITLATKAVGRINPDEKVDALVNYIKSIGLDLLTWDDASKQYLSRMKLMAGQSGWPRFDENYLLQNIQTWLGPYLTNVTTLADIKALPLLQSLKSLLDWQQQKILDELLPERMKVPSGSNITIDYQSNPPVLAVKLQEMFGCQTTPTVMNGQLALMVHLLSPAGRPLQVTQDLQGFWQGAYQEVKKEMKGRYPKHPWPDDPITAIATHRTKKAQQQSRGN